VVSGSSFAAPHVTGAMALLKSAFADAPISQIETALYDSAIDLGEPGADDQFGYGLVDVSAAYDLLYSSYGSEQQSQLLFSQSLYSVDESTQRLIVTVRRLGLGTGEVSVDYTSIDDEAQSGSDYVRQSGRLTFAAGETLRSFEVPIINDHDDEENESFHLLLSNVRGEATLGDQDEVEVIILDDDGAGSIAFDNVSVAVNEARGEALVTLIRTGGTTGNVVVNYRTVADTAIADSDFVTTEGKVRFLTGETEKQITVELIDDTLFEGSERFQLIITDLAGEAEIGEPGSTTVTILDDDPDSRFASISLEAVSYEISENSANISLDVIRKGNLDTAVSVAYNTLDGSAKQDVDYLPISGSLNFAEGISQQRLSISILNDTFYEAESSFSLILSDASNGAVISDPGAAIIRILDDDALPFVSIQSPTPRSSANLGNSGLNNRQSSGQGHGKKAQQSRSSELQIFKLNVKNYAESNQQENENIQDLENNLKEVAKNEDAESSSCGSGSGSDSAQSNCVAESDEIDKKTDMKTEQTLSKKSSTESRSESATGILEKSDKSESPAVTVDSDPATTE
jgi:hypothetical protein